MIEHINDRLNVWALWVQRRVSAGLGYPHECAYTRLQGRSGYRGFISPDDCEQAWEIEQAVQALPEELRRVVHVFYLRLGTCEAKARDLGCHRVTLYIRLDRAHVAIMDWLNGYYAGSEESMRHDVSAACLKKVTTTA